MVVLFVVEEGGLGFVGLVAARALQKRVLVGLARHWLQVPGPLMQGFEVVAMVVSDSGGVGKVDAGVLRV